MQLIDTHKMYLTQQVHKRIYGQDIFTFRYWRTDVYYFNSIRSIRFLF